MSAVGLSARVSRTVIASYAELRLWCSPGRTRASPLGCAGHAGSATTSRICWTSGPKVRSSARYLYMQPASHTVLSVVTGSHLLVMFLVGWLLFCLCCCFCVFVFRSLCFVFKVPCRTIKFLFSFPLYYYGFAFGFTVGFLLVCLFGILLVFSCFIIDQYILYYFLFLFS